MRMCTFLVALLAACGGTSDPPDDNGQEPPPPLALRVREVASGLSNPLFLDAPAGDARLFVVEQAGRIRIVENGQLRAEPFLDVSAKVSTGGERGLLGLAFHPRYATNGWFYVNYTDRDGDTRVERYRVSSDRNRADAASASLVIAVDQPYANHNGGMLAFGPDGMLYVGMGDGGSGGDPQNNAQNLFSLLGKLLRLDVDGATPYAIPPSNPYFVASSARNEIWASGLRNPWRFSFDRVDGRLYIADVGQSALEEVNVAGVGEAGLDYGWRTMEGTSCYGAATCSRAGLRLPVLEYGRGDGCSITGGYVYRGSIAGIRGHYFYSDYCRGWLRSAVVSPTGAVSDRREWDVGALGQVLSFGQDSAGELYVLSGNGRVYRIEAAS
jgi:glucose/arabinose dehydrogenase